MDPNIQYLNEKIREQSQFLRILINEIGKMIVGQKYMVERMLVGLLANGHILLEGVPGLAKTLTVSTLAKSIKTKFQRIQFTPDLLPADLIGTMIYNPRDGSFSPKKGPIFSNLILADEINRAPAKVQSALLEAMQERQVTIGENTYPLDDPFLVLGTQNPIEQEGTYPLPEAQVDRFMLKLKITYPNKNEEKEIMEKISLGNEVVINPVTAPEEIKSARLILKEMYMDDKIKNYIIDIISATRDPKSYKLDIGRLIAYGASPRASIYLNIASRALAFIRGRGFVTPEDIKSVAMDVLRHRIIVTYEAEAEEINSENIIQKILDEVEVP